MLKEDRDIALVSSDYRLMNFNTSLLKTKTTTNTQGVQAFTAKKGRSVTTVGTTEEILGAGVSAEKFTAQSLPSAGALMKEVWIRGLTDNVSKPNFIAGQALETGKILYCIFAHRG